MKKTTSIDLLKTKLDKIRQAQSEFSTFSQEQVDEIFRQAALAANNSRIHLANGC